MEDATHYVTQDASLSGTVYPSYSSFVGLRLDLDSREPIGLISIMHDKPLEKQQLDHIACILKAVQRRVTNEISRLRQRDNLIVIKNAALQDAEYKLRFLADMSHEIRYTSIYIHYYKYIMYDVRANINLKKDAIKCCGCINRPAASRETITE